jgi:RND superfamily putative drug exporter
MKPDLADLVVRHRRGVVLGWLAVAALLLPGAQQLEQRLALAASLPDSESARVALALRERLASPLAESALVVVTGVPAPDTPAGRAALAGLSSELSRAPGVLRAFSYLDAPDPLLLPAQGDGALLLVGLDPTLGREALVVALRDAAARATRQLRLRHPAATVRVTGEAALNVDLRRASLESARSAELLALPLSLGLLLLVFGALVAAGLPLLIGALAIGLASGTLALLALAVPLTATLQSVVSMLGLGLGIDYALLAVSRFREELARGDVERAAAETARRAGRTVAVSSLAVVIGLGALAGSGIDELRSIALGGAVVTAFAALLATTLLPALLALLGPRIDAGRVTLPRSWLRPPDWGAWAHRVVAHPAPWAAAALLPLLLLASAVTRLSTDLPRGNWLPAGLESAQAIDDLERLGRRGLVQTVRVLLELPPDAFALGAAGWSAQTRLAAALASDARVARVRTLGDLAGEHAADLAYVSLMPALAKRCFVGQEGDVLLLEIVPRERAEPGEVAALVRELRRADAAALTGLPGARLAVGGLPAFNVDYEDAVAGRLPVTVLGVVAASLLALLLAFRSLLVPLKAVALNLLSVAAALGAVVLVFQEGHLGGLVGLSAGTAGVFPALPILVFGVVFGLSLDYEVFLVARVAEARRSGVDEHQAIAEGVARTAGVITGAAAVMVVVFAAFVSEGFLLVKMLGFALAVAVVLDATLVRLVAGPALLALLGRLNWWPGDRRGAIPAVRGPVCQAPGT